MKKMIHLMTCAVVATMSMEAARATLNIPSNGSDGHLVVTNNLVIDLSRAITAPWDSISTDTNIGVGRYDPEKWATVYHYQSVTIQSGATVTFINHPSHAPVVWLVQGDVTINGTINVSGQGGVSAPWLAEPGPGGFRAGAGNYSLGVANAAGFGPGGGARITPNQDMASGGSYGTGSWYGPAAYGNPSLIPLIGGSGGGGGYSNSGSGNSTASGGAGGGAILIASSTTLTVTGQILANGGIGVYQDSRWSGGGSGGGVRLVAEKVQGGGVVNAIGGGVWMNGGLGRIRVERGADISNLNLAVNPGPDVVVLASGATPQIWLPANGPAVRIVSIGGNTPPADPRAGFGAIGADTVLPTVSSTTVVVETTNVERVSAVTIRATPRTSGNYSEVVANLAQVVSEDPLVIRWTNNVPVNNGYSAIQVKVVRP